MITARKTSLTPFASAADLGSPAADGTAPRVITDEELDVVGGGICGVVVTVVAAWSVANMGKEYLKQRLNGDCIDVSNILVAGIPT